VIETPLLRRLRSWAKALKETPTTTPRVVLLVGGPGNGKTEAVESAILALDEALNLSGTLTAHLKAEFIKKDFSPVPRLAIAPLSNKSSTAHPSLVVVQDASVNDPQRPEIQPAQLLVEDLEKYAIEPTTAAYLACVNRGILDDALIFATEGQKTEVARLVSQTIRAVGVNPDAISCWPLAIFSHVAVWPMDVETLVATAGDDGSPGSTPAAEQLLAVALKENDWPQFGKCAGGDLCPHCNSRNLLSDSNIRANLLTILRWYELASGKRWTFRDLNSLISYLLAGAHSDDAGIGSPCDWAARQVVASASNVDRTRTARRLAPYLLVSAQYQHALFGSWSSKHVRILEKDLRSFEEKLTMGTKDTVVGLFRFLAGTRGASVPATLQSQLAVALEFLDPALADPETPIGKDGEKTLRDVDVRFSQSVGAGLAFVRPHRWLTAPELGLLERLRDADTELSDGETRRASPVAASRLQAALRDFACRLVRRSLGVRFAFTRDAALLREFEQVAEGQKELLHDASKQVELLLNEKEKFEICLNTTFGEPLPPRAHRALLRTMKQKVKALQLSLDGRPASSVRFLQIGSTKNPPQIPLTYELFRSVRELRGGLLRASLPRTVVALLDTTRARLAGVVVRDSEVLDDAQIFLGERPEVIGRELDSFIVYSRGDS
jgi:hypothetical protein